MPENRLTPIASIEAARLLGVDARTVQRHAERGELPTLGKLPGRTGAFLFDRATIEDLATKRAALAEGGDAA